MDKGIAERYEDNIFDEGVDAVPRVMVYRWIDRSRPRTCLEDGERSRVRRDFFPRAQQNTPYRHGQGYSAYHLYKIHSRDELDFLNSQRAEKVNGFKFRRKDNNNALAEISVGARSSDMPPSSCVVPK